MFEIQRIDCTHERRGLLALWQLFHIIPYTGLQIRRSNKDNLGIIIKISS